MAAAAVGGLRPALAAAVGADLLVNFFFIPPYHTFVVETRDHAIVLAVYVAGGRHRRRRRRGGRPPARHRRPPRRRSRAAGAQATADPVAEESLTRLLAQVRDTFAMTAVALLESRRPHRRASRRRRRRRPAASRPALSAPAGDGLRIAAWGPQLIGEDRRALARLAAAAARTLEAQRLAARRPGPGNWPRSTGCGPPCSPPSATTFARRSPGSRPPCPACASPTWSCSADDRDELLATIEESTDRLADLVENLLSMSRLQAGVLQRPPGPGRPGRGRRPGRAAPTRTAAPRRVDVPDDLPLVHTDPGLLERVVANLIANACTASPAGPAGPVVRGAPTATGYALDVIDHGPGVPTDDRDRIFAPFQRLDDRGHAAWASAWPSPAASPRPWAAP